jgi:hypothetical protein
MTKSEDMVANMTTATAVKREFRDVNLQRNIKFSFKSKALEKLMGFVDISFPVHKTSKQYG